MPSIAAQPYGRRIGKIETQLTVKGYTYTIPDVAFKRLSKITNTQYWPGTDPSLVIQELIEVPDVVIAILRTPSHAFQERDDVAIHHLGPALDDDPVDSPLDLKEARLVCFVAVPANTQLEPILDPLQRLPTKSQVIGVQVKAHKGIRPIDTVGIWTHVWANVCLDSRRLSLGDEVFELVAAPHRPVTIL